MTQTIGEEIIVSCYFDSPKKQVKPVAFYWRSRKYSIEKLGLYHQYRDGRNIIHVFGIIANNLYFRLELSSANLVWKLVELNDGQAD